MKVNNKLSNKIFEIIILIILLSFVGYVINKLDENLASVDSSVLKVEINYGDLLNKDGSNTNGVKFTKEFEEKIDGYVKDKILNYSNIVSSRIDNVVTVTSIFFTVLVVLVTLFQYLKGKSYEEKLEKYDAEIEEYSKELEENKKNYINELNLYKNSMKILVNINSLYIKSINYNINKNHIYAIKEYEKILDISEGQPELLNSLDLKDLYTNISYSYEQVEMYDQAINCLLNIIDINLKKFLDKEYLSLYIKYCKLLVKKSIKLNILEFYINTLKVITELKNINTYNLGLEYDDILRDINFDVTFAKLNICIGKLLFESNKFGEAKSYLEKGLLIYQKNSKSDLLARIYINKIYISNPQVININFNEFFNNYNFILEHIGNKLYQPCDSIGYVDSPKYKKYIVINDSNLVRTIIDKYIIYAEKKKEESVFYKEALRKIYLIYNANSNMFGKDEDILKGYQDKIKEIIKSDGIAEHNFGYDPFEESDFSTDIL